MLRFRPYKQNISPLFAHRMRFFCINGTEDSAKKPPMNPKDYENIIKNINEYKQTNLFQKNFWALAYLTPA